VKTLLGWIVKVSLYLFRKILDLALSVIISKKFLSYENIPLKTYFEIALKGDFTLVQVKGVKDQDKCIEVWEKIVEETSTATNNFKYISYRSVLNSYNILMADYNAIKASISVLQFEVIDREISYLLKKGYKINTKGSSEDYARSLIAAETKSNALIARLKLKMSELEQLSKGEQANASNTFDTVMADLMSKGIAANENITLSRYNELVKVLNKKSNG